MAELRESTAVVQGNLHEQYSGIAELGCAFRVIGRDAYVNLRGYSEFWSEKRLEGKAAYLTLSIPLGSNPPGSNKKTPGG